jgi:hypothetical protein
MFTVLLPFLVALSLIVPPPPVQFPTGSTIDVGAIAEVVETIDPLDLIDALDQSIADRDLPDAFQNPPRGETAVIEEFGDGFAFAAEDYPGGIESVTLSFDTNPRVVSSPVSGGVINYVVTDHDISRSEVRIMYAGLEDEFDEGIGEDLPEGFDSATGTVDLIDVGGVESISALMEMEGTGFALTMGIVFVPVAYTLVISMVMVAGFGESGDADVPSLALELVDAALRQLEAVATSVA